MKDFAVRGQTGNLAFVFLQDSASTTGAGKTGLTNASAALNVSVRREKSATFSAYTGANIGSITTLGIWADPGAGKCNFKEMDATNAPGMYEIHFVDSIFNASDTSRKLVGMVTATGIAPCPFEITLAALDIQTDIAQTGDSFARLGAAGAGLTALGDTRIANLDATITSRMATYTQPTGFLAATFPPDPADQSLIIAATDAIISDTNDIQARLPAALTANGNMKSSLVEILTTALTETVGQLAGGFKKFFNLAAPVSTMDVLARVTLTDTVTTYTGNTPQTGDCFARLGAPVGVNLSADIAAVQADTDNIQTRIPAALTADGNIKADTLRVGGALQTGGDIPAMITAVDDYVDTEVAAIKAKTDSLTFTVAGQVDANVKSVNNITVTGNGQAGTEWGP